MYGQTECKRITYLEPDDFERKPGSVGRGMPYQDHAVVDASGVPVPVILKVANGVAIYVESE